MFVTSENGFLQKNRPKRREYRNTTPLFSRLRDITGFHYGYPPLKILPPSKDEVLKKCLRIPPSKDGVLKKYLKIPYPQDIFYLETLGIFYIEVQFFSLGGSAPTPAIIFNVF